jgi:hypothetical protein
MRILYTNFIQNKMNALKEAITDLKEYLGESYCQSIDGKMAVAEEWRQKQDYHLMQNYVYDLAQCHALPSRKALNTILKRIITENHIEEIADIGAGICSDVIEFDRMGIKTQAIEVKSPHFDFGIWRLNKHNCKTDALYIDEQTNLPVFDKDVQCVMFIDTLEHIDDPIEYISCVSEYTDMIIEKTPFNTHNVIDGQDAYPMHTRVQRRDVNDHLQNLNFYKQHKINAYAPNLWIRQ